MGFYGQQALVSLNNDNKNLSDNCSYPDSSLTNSQQSNILHVNNVMGAGDGSLDYLKASNANNSSFLHIWGLRNYDRGRINSDSSDGYRYAVICNKVVTSVPVFESEVDSICDSANPASVKTIGSYTYCSACDYGYSTEKASAASSKSVIFTNDLSKVITRAFICDGVDISDSFIQPSNPRFYLEFIGKNYHGDDITENHLVEFTDEDIEAGYKDIVYTNGFVGVQNCRAYNADYQVCGNGVVTIQGKYINLTDIGLSVLDTALNCIGAATSPLNIISCVASAFGLVGDIFSSLRNIGTFTFSSCDKFAAFNPDLDFAATSVNYTDDDTVTLTNWLYPVIRVYISAGFEPMTDQDWCCDSYDVNEKSGGSGSITIYPHEPVQPGEPEGPGGGEGGGDDDCICYWLERIKGKFEIMIEKLDGIRQAILGLKLECNTTVEPCEPQIVNQFEPQITVSPCEPQITVQPGEQQIIVQPAEPQVIVNNDIDLTGIEAELSGIKIGIDNIDFDGDVNVDAEGIEAKLEDIKTSLDEFQEGLKENLEDLGDDILASEPQVHISGDDVETVHGKKVRRSITDADDYARITDDVREDGSSYQPNDNP